MWDLSCPNWAELIRNRQSILPALPLFESEARMGLAFFDVLHLPDVPGLPLMREAAGDWFRDIVRIACGSRDPASNERMVREIFALVPKGQSKTTYGAGLMDALALMNLRPRAEMLFVGPTQAISDLAFSQAAGMIEADEALKKRFRVVEHLKEIVDLVTKAKLKVKTFDLNILTGPKPVVVLIDELHLLGRNAHASKVLRQIRGGLEKNPEGLLIMITTQSDEPPAGVFRDELLVARKIRDGQMQGRMLPILYEFPPDIARDAAKWQDPANWDMVMPNLGRSMWLDSLVQDWNTEKVKGEHAIRVWASQHLNIEIGIGLRTDAWAGAEYWERGLDATLTLDELLGRVEVVVIGLDGGGLDDLFGLTVLGRERGTKNWLSWSHAWCHEGVLERRQTIAARLLDFRAAGELDIVNDELEEVAGTIALIEPGKSLLLPKEQVGILKIAARVQDAGLLAAIAVDNEGPYGELIDALGLIGVAEKSGQLVGVGQGYRLMNAIKTSERKLANRTLRHAPSSMMDWCVANVKIEPTATAIRATKQNAGDLKIDPVMSLFDAVTVMTTNPEPGDGGPSVYESRDVPLLMV
jgi:phage terminase large subunit-like protein